MTTSTRLARARHAVKLAETEFNARKRREWEDLSARLRMEVEDAVIELRDAGVSIREIGEQYGTKDRATIYRILNKRAAQTAVTTSPETVTVTKEDDVYTLTVGDETVSFEWDDEFHNVLMFLDFDPSSALVAELRKENNAYAAQIEAI